uniref:WD repeat-containing protein 55 homolog n=1 Tax=Clastoptera arizonana TaxID=38151 RepID=A0A1B6E1Q1_9HEMI
MRDYKKHRHIDGSDDDDDSQDMITSLLDYESSDTSEDSDSSESSKPESVNQNATGNIGGDEEEDIAVSAIRRAQERNIEKPQEVYHDDLIVDISFHPSDDIIAAATIVGDVLIYKYSVVGTELVKTLEVHRKSCRAVEFSSSGKTVITGSKDKSLIITDVETTKLNKCFDDAHEDPLYCLLEVNENVIASGDENGVVKLWDLRQNKQISSFKKMEDYVSSIISNDERRYIVCTSGEGTVTSFDMRSRNMHIQSEVFEAELTCAAIVGKSTKLVVGSSQGSLLFYNWEQFGLHVDELPTLGKKAINCMIPISENIVITGWEDGVLRATYLLPNRNLGIVGQHSLSVENLDISHDGEYIASCSLDQKLRFWPISYFEDLNTISSTNKNPNHNLPSSNFSNRGDFFADLAN